MNTSAVEVINGLIEQLTKTEKELAALKETVNQFMNASDTTNDEESGEEEQDYRFWTAKPGDMYYALWVTDCNKAYKNPIIVCEDSVEPDMFSDDDFYDLEHNISIFQNKQDADRYAKHLNIDLTVYRLKCHYLSNVDSYNADLIDFRLVYFIDNNGVVHMTHCSTVPPFSCVMLSTSVTGPMLEWMKPILSKYFDIKFDI